MYQKLHQHGINCMTSESFRMTYWVWTLKMTWLLQNQPNL
uniref:Uncharacterized protein n=1 Tax=Rhizophora mucronata TaxID=61149 RepID=A0A2P2MZE5_RHIMU